jgi:hypothetical protein
MLLDTASQYNAVELFDLRYSVADIVVVVVAVVLTLDLLYWLQTTDDRDIDYY